MIWPKAPSFLGLLQSPHPQTGGLCVSIYPCYLRGTTERPSVGDVQNMQGFVKLMQSVHRVQIISTECHVSVLFQCWGRRFPGHITSLHWLPLKGALWALHLCHQRHAARKAPGSPEKQSWPFCAFLCIFPSSPELDLLGETWHMPFHYKDTEFYPGRWMVTFRSWLSCSSPCPIPNEKRRGFARCSASVKKKVTSDAIWLTTCRRRGLPKNGASFSS